MPKPDEVIQPDFETVKIPIRRQLGHRISEGPPPPPPDFSVVLAQMSKYREATRHLDEVTTDWIAEAQWRLEHCAFMIARVDRLQKLYTRARRRGRRSPEISGKRRDVLADRLSTEILIFAEAFYYCAFRLSAIFGKLLKHRTFKPRGVTIVRNQLIEHAEGSGASNPNFVFGEDLHHGPVMKPFGARNDATLQDDGLYVNANELIADLERLLSRRLSDLAPGPTKAP